MEESSTTRISGFDVGFDTLFDKEFCNMDDLDKSRICGITPYEPDPLVLYLISNWLEVISCV